MDLTNDLNVQMIRYQPSEENARSDRAYERVEHEAFSCLPTSSNIIRPRDLVTDTTQTACRLIAQANSYLIDPNKGVQKLVANKNLTKELRDVERTMQVFYSTSKGSLFINELDDVKEILKKIDVYTDTDRSPWCCFCF